MEVKRADADADADAHLLCTQECGVTPTDRLLDHVMQATAQAKQWALAEGVFRAMTEKYGHGSLVTYQSMGHFVEVRQAC